MDGWMGGWMDRWMDGWMVGWNGLMVGLDAISILTDFSLWEAIILA